jgi:hypothetical protein
MNTTGDAITGGCLCGQLRYQARGAPGLSGYCFCIDCRKASGSGFIPFMGFASAAVEFSGEARQVRSPAFRGGEAVRNFCPACGGLVFGGERGKDSSHTIYAGSLDDASQFEPKIAIFAAGRPAWALIPPQVEVFDALPPPPPRASGN